MSTLQDSSLEQSRIYWQCRRGMLELDLMLQPFVENHFAGLTPRQRHALATLLRYPDQQLLDYLLGHGVPHDKDVADVAEQIRNAAGT
ncbi:MAG: succinate dehydrogenase assembly factor 2 [Thiohalophilus sp.]